MNATLLPTATGTQTWRAVRTLARPHRLLTTATITVLIAAAAAGLLVPPIIGHIVDLVTTHHGPGSITAPIIWLAAAAIAQAILTGLGDMLVARLGETILATLRERVVTHALDLPLDQIERAGSGELIARVSGDVSVVADAVRTALPAPASAGLTIGLTIAGLATLDWRFAVAGIVAAPIQIYTLRWYLTRSTPLYAAERVAEGARTQQLLDSIGGNTTIRAYGLTDTAVADVRDRSAAALGYGLRANRLATRFFGRLNLAELVGLTAILSLGFWLVRDGAATIGAATAAALYFHRLFDPINTLLGLFATAQEATAGLARLVGVTTSPAATPSPTPQTHPATVSVADVSFVYPGGPPVLHHISFDIAAGEHIALVGASGAGKTSIAKLLAGIHHPDTGTVTTDAAGKSATAADSGVGHGVALVTQEVHVFAGTLAEDLRLAAPEASEAHLAAALDRVHARSWVDALPDGLATIVGDGGHPLTTTQAQQIALARLVLADPAIAILDEATADAGSAGARILDRAAAAALQGRTALIVAHRLSQAAGADRILVLDGGRIVERGDHATLLATGGTYATLWTAWRHHNDPNSPDPTGDHDPISAPTGAPDRLGR